MVVVGRVAMILGVNQGEQLDRAPIEALQHVYEYGSVFAQVILGDRVATLTVLGEPGASRRAEADTGQELTAVESAGTICHQVLARPKTILQGKALVVGIVSLALRELGAAGRALIVGRLILEVPGRFSVATGTTDVGIAGCGVRVDEDIGDGELWESVYVTALEGAIIALLVLIFGKSAVIGDNGQHPSAALARRSPVDGPVDATTAAKI